MHRLGFLLLTLVSVTLPSVRGTAAPAVAPASLASLRAAVVPPGAQPHLVIECTTLCRQLAAQGLPSPWPTAAGRPGGRVSVAFGPAGRMAVAYLSGRNPVAKVAQFDGGTWEVATVDSAGLFFWLPSVAFAPDGTAAVAYVETGRGEMRVARRQRGAWQTHTLAWPDLTCGNPSLRFAANGSAEISFADPIGSGARCAQFDGRVWQVIAVNTGASADRRPSLSDPLR